MASKKDSSIISLKRLNTAYLEKIKTIMEKALY